MDKGEKLSLLQNLDEDMLTTRFIIPLLSEGMNCQNVQYIHGVFEAGKDIVYCTRDEYDHPIYAGVQVKATKITSRNIKIIFSQITESLGKSFRDLDGKKRNLDKFVLITSDKLTEGARKSFWRSLKGVNLQRVVTLIEGRELIDLLDRYLPSAFWDQYDYFGKYSEAMISELERIKDISAIGQKSPIPLEDIYVSLRLSVKSESEISEIDKRELILDADDAAERFDRLVIVGAPASGKTTLLKHLALRFCKQILVDQKKTVLPIFITLKKFSESSKTLRKFINDIFEHFDFPRAEEILENELGEGRCLLLLDGFDELTSKESQQRITTELEEFIRVYEKNRFIVTSRAAGYNDELESFQKLEVLEFDDKQIELFITNWFGESDIVRASSMCRTIQENERIRAIAQNPLMIAIIAIIYEEDEELPQRRVELYKRCVEMLLGRWDVVHKIKNKYKAKAKEKILRKLALEAHISEKESFTNEEILRKFCKYLPEVRISEKEAEDVLDEIVKRNALLRKIAHNEYGFLHVSFQEHLAALELWERRDYVTLLQHLHDPWWEEVILLFVGFDRDATELIVKVRGKKNMDELLKEDTFYSDLMIFGKCIADADYTSKEIRDQIVNDLWSIYQTGMISSHRRESAKLLALIKPDNIINLLIEKLDHEDSFVRGEAVKALADIGSEKIVESLINTLTTDRVSYVRMEAAIALGRIGSEKAVDPLINTLTTDRVSYVRMEAAEALGRIGSEKAVEPLIKVLTTDEDRNVRKWAAEVLEWIGKSNFQK